MMDLTVRRLEGICNPFMPSQVAGMTLAFAREDVNSSSQL